ncbi:MAG TPA: T9SS type A sorting domain-containing protein, partial [Clostridia bacterium]|nr:T9SS type A sorting domain-containing protein [Clostridia bacterium]
LINNRGEKSLLTKRSILVTHDVGPKIVEKLGYYITHNGNESELYIHNLREPSSLINENILIDTYNFIDGEEYQISAYAVDTWKQMSPEASRNFFYRRNSSPEKLKEQIALTLTTGDEFRIAMDTIFDDVDLEYGDTLVYAHQSASTPSLEDFLSWEDETNLLLNPISGYEGEYSFELVATDKFDEQELIPVILDVNMPTAVEHYRENTISLYPNPVKEKLTIEAPFEQKVLSVNLFNLQGELKYQWTGKLKRLSLDVRSLNAGTYMIAIYTTNGVVKRKIIIQ